MSKATNVTALNVLSSVPFVNLYAEKLEGKQVQSIDLVPMHEVLNVNDEVVVVTSDEMNADKDSVKEVLKDFQRLTVTLAPVEVADGEEPIPGEVIELCDVDNEYDYQRINQSLSIVHHRALGNELKALYSVTDGSLIPLQAEAFVATVRKFGEEATIEIGGDSISFIGADSAETYAIENLDDVDVMTTEAERAQNITHYGEVMRLRTREGVSDILFDGYNADEIQTIFEKLAANLVHIGGDMFVGDDYSVHAVRQPQDQMMQMQNQQGPVMAFRCIVPYGKFTAVDAFANKFLK